VHKLLDVDPIDPGELPKISTSGYARGVGSNEASSQPRGLNTESLIPRG
jgi:hypothetical protein